MKPEQGWGLPGVDLGLPGTALGLLGVDLGLPSYKASPALCSQQ